MNNKNKISGIVFSVYILLEFYVFGAGVVNSLVAYRTWRWVGEKEFPKFHQIDSSLIIPIFVIFFFISFIPQILLFWFRPLIISKWLVWLALFFNLKAYFVYGNEENYNKVTRQKELEKLGNELNLKNIALTFVSSMADTESEVNLNKINPNVENTFVIFKN